jgi:hypothetical protein
MQSNASAARKGFRFDGRDYRRSGGRKENLYSLCFVLFKSGPVDLVELDFDKRVSDGVNIEGDSGFESY